MNIDDLKPFWQAYKIKWKEDQTKQMPDIQTLISQHSPKSAIGIRRNYLWMNSGIYLFLLLCVNGC